MGPPKKRPQPSKAISGYYVDIFTGYHPSMISGVRINSNDRKHASDFNPRDIGTHGYFCPYCFWELLYDDVIGYYCECSSWQENSKQLAERFEGIQP